MCNGVGQPNFSSNPNWAQPGVSESLEQFSFDPPIGAVEEPDGFLQEQQSFGCELGPLDDTEPQRPSNDGLTQQTDQPFPISESCRIEAEIMLSALKQRVAQDGSEIDLDACSIS